MDNKEFDRTFLKKYFKWHFILIAGIVGILLLSVVWKFFPIYYDFRISGRVVDKETGEPVEGALVIAKWALSGALHSEPGGFIKVHVIKTDDEGKFLVPSWIIFDPHKWYYHVDYSTYPKIIIYKPGYATYSSYKSARTGHEDNRTLTQKEKDDLWKKYSITPARLARTHTDEELWGEFLEFESNRGFLGDYPLEELENMFNVIEDGMFSVPEGKNKLRILEQINKRREFHLGGQQRM